MMDNKTTLPKGFSVIEPQFNHWYASIHDKVPGSPKTTKAALFYLLAMVFQQKITQVEAGQAFGVTSNSVCRKVPRVIDALKREKIIPTFDIVEPENQA